MVNADVSLFFRIKDLRVSLKIRQQAQKIHSYNDDQEMGRFLVTLLLLNLSQAHMLVDRIAEYRNIPFSQAEIDDVTTLLDSVASTTGGNIIRPFQPQRWWLWKCWSGTVLQQVLPSVAFNMCATLILVVILRKVSHGSWPLGVKPDTHNPFIARLALFDDVWKYLMTLTTFILTFFVGESYTLWKSMYTTCRKIQGRLNDISLLLATHAKRDQNTGEYTPQAREFLNNISINIRAFHLLLWASSSRHYAPLLTEQGALQLVHRGILTRQQVNTLANLETIPPTQWHCVVLEWIIIDVQEALQTGVLTGGAPVSLLLMEKCLELRGTFGSISDVLSGRMPLAYTHLVQILVDSLLSCAPLAQFAELGVFAVISVGILTLFFQGLLDLGKVFLDPLDNEDYCQESVKIDLGVLIREVNAASNRWKLGAELLPYETTTTTAKPMNSKQSYTTSFR